MRSELLNSKGNTNAIWKIINNCLPRKTQNHSFKTENSTGVVKKFNEHFTSVGSLTVQKARDLAVEYNLNICPTVLNVDSIPDQCMESF